MSEFATSVADFILALHRIDSADGPRAGAHSFYRGAALAHYDAETRRALAVLDGRIDTDTASAVWNATLGATWLARPVRFHGDIASGNLLVRSGEVRRTFRNTVGQDPATWARARGWALWKALISLVEDINTNDERAAVNQHVIDEVLADQDLVG